jgi:hypothetical protein
MDISTTSLAFFVQANPTPNSYWRLPTSLPARQQKPCDTFNIEVEKRAIWSSLQGQQVNGQKRDERDRISSLNEGLVRGFQEMNTGLRREMAESYAGTPLA